MIGSFLISANSALSFSMEALNLARSALALKYNKIWLKPLKKTFSESLIYHIFWVCEGYLKFDPLTASEMSGLMHWALTMWAIL